MHGISFLHFLFIRWKLPFRILTMTMHKTSENRVYQNLSCMTSLSSASSHSSFLIPQVSHGFQKHQTLVTPGMVMTSHVSVPLLLRWLQSGEHTSPSFSWLTPERQVNGRSRVWIGILDLPFFTCSMTRTDCLMFESHSFITHTMWLTTVATSQRCCHA